MKNLFMFFGAVMLLLLLGAVPGSQHALAQEVAYDTSSSSQATPLIEMDKADYPPGATASISGSGFQASEAVTLQVLHADGTLATGNDHLPWSVNADADGNIVTTWHVCEDDCIGSLLELTATGAASGRIGRILFSDAATSNGGFETGNFSGWAIVNSGSGNWFNYTGTLTPPPVFTINAPPQGTRAAVTNQSGPGSHILYQDLVLEPSQNHTLSFKIYYRNRASQFVTPASLSQTGGSNQQYRVDIIKTTASVLSVAASDVLLNIFRTNVGDPLTLAPTTFTVNLTPFAGTTVRLRFAEVDNQGFFHASVDDVQVTSAPAGTPPAITCPANITTNVSSGLVSWWPGDGNANDIIDANHGTLQNGATFASGKVGQAFSFDGINDFVQVPDASNLDITSQITIAAWIKPATLGGRILDKVTAGTGDGYLLDTFTGRLRLLIDGRTVFSVGALPLNTFTHVAGVYNGSTMQVYINGVLDGSFATSVAIPTNNL